MMKPVYFVLLAILMSVELWAQTGSVPVDTNIWIPNGLVRTIVKSNNTLYLGGNFSYVGPNTGGGVPIGTVSGATVNGFPKIHGTVETVVADGAGGWFVGGDFDKVSGLPIRNVVHIRANNQLDSNWRPNPNGRVYALALSGNTVYLGGSFGFLGAARRRNVAAVDAQTGQVRPWSADVNNFVLALAVANGRVYLGGNFTTVNNTTRNYGAALDSATGNLTGWNPNTSAAILCMVPAGQRMIIGGRFRFQQNNSNGAYLASVDLSAGIGSSVWSAGCNGDVNALCLIGNTLYAGGSFSRMGGQNRSSIAALNVTTGATLTTWNASLDRGTVYAIVSDGNTVYVGGRIPTLVGGTRDNLAAFNAITGSVTSWAPVADNTVEALAISGNRIYAGGIFTSVGAVRRNCVAAINTLTGQATAWNPNVSHTTTNPVVNALSVHNGKVYIGGDFRSIGTVSKQNLAEVDSATGLATAWNPYPEDRVVTLKKVGTSLYVGGWFTSISNTSRWYISEYDLTTKTLTAWNPNVRLSSTPNDNGNVNAIEVRGNTVYLSGLFQYMAGVPRNFLAAVDRVTGQLLNWNPNPNGSPLCLAQGPDALHVAGIYTAIGGASRSSVAAIDYQTGLATGFVANSPSIVNAISVNGNQLYVAGSFPVPSPGFAYNNLASVNTVAGAINNWRPDPDRDLTSLVQYADKLYVGGGFKRIFGTYVPYFTAITVPTLTNLAKTSEAPTAGKLKLTPNPASSTVRLETEYGHIQSIMVADNLGRLVLQTNTLTDNLLDISSMPPGTYFVKVQTDRGAFTQRLSVVR